jgi:Calcineurin-like phosphoesterase
MQRSLAGFCSLITCLVVAGCADDAAVTPVSPIPSAAQVSGSQDRSAQIEDEAISEDGEDSDMPYTLAVIGDTPYGAAKLAEFPALIAKINSDPRVRLVAHVGDIKAGSSSPCTDEYFEMIRALFDEFEDPLAYTPGDNEWTDCHVASKNNGLYTPTERLQKVRSLFFPIPGRTLGQQSMHVVTEGRDPANAAYVENTLWKKARVVFAELNVTGSNNDLAPWGTPLPPDAGSYPTQSEEYATRARANSTWLEKAFATAERTHAAGIVLLIQADMWDGTTSTLSGYDALVEHVGTLAQSFGKPVLLINGDSHVFRVDNPFSAASPLHAIHASTPVANNVIRIIVEGSAAGRTEYLRLTIDPRNKSNSLFAWERVPLN